MYVCAVYMHYVCVACLCYICVCVFCVHVLYMCAVCICVFWACAIYIYMCCVYVCVCCVHVSYVCVVCVCVCLPYLHRQQAAVQLGGASVICGPWLGACSQAHALSQFCLVLSLLTVLMLVFASTHVSQEPPGNAPCAVMAPGWGSHLQHRLLEL